ncbi:MAG: T9SS type A sorting domain-containing protein [Ignavibacteriae bacterium]|nr:T9SS type A sorting domain-containing protein [Ignavibacteriota bacterium]
MKYFVDHTYGEIYADLFSNGTTIPAWGTAKGNGSKAGYHSIETGYYAYLYGNLFYNDNPIELYYKIEPVDYNREIVLSPLAINSQLSIKEVIWDNEPYPNYISDTRRLIVNAGVGGKIKVIFETDYPISVPASETLAPKFELSQNYPNPFNPSTIIRYTIPEAGNVSLKIYDVLGREVRTLINKELNSGEHEIEFDAGSLSSGIYFYNLKTGNFTSTKKLILLK